MRTYFIATVGAPFFKVGKSVDPMQRLREIQCGCPLECAVICTLDGDHERAIHAALKECRTRGEWFELNTHAIGVFRALGLFEIAGKLHERHEKSQGRPADKRDRWKRSCPACREAEVVETPIDAFVAREAMNRLQEWRWGHLRVTA